MAKEEKPLEYERRIRDTKGVAQRLDLGYLGRPALLVAMRRKLTWVVLAASVAFATPLILGIGWSRKALSAGPVSSAHAIFEGRCQDCHTQAFRRVPDRACLTCHDGPPHPAKNIDTARIGAAPPCYGCHVEHRGEMELAKVSDGNCTSCHANLTAHAQGVKLQAVAITAFRPGRHPEFAAGGLPDARPIKLNHAAHMPAKAKTIRGIQLPMNCQDCHVTDSGSTTGNLLPVTFEQNCRSCHARELEFDVYQLLGAGAVPSPHTKDPQTIHQFIAGTYRKLLEADPSLVRRPLGNEFTAAPDAAAWLDRVTKDSEQFLFQRKCSYCHEYEGFDQGFPVVKKVNRIYGRYVQGKPEGAPWLERGEFRHRAHRAVLCESCHTAARASMRTADVLIPVMKTCLPCHQDSRAGLNRCSECHLYHNKSLEKDNRRPAGQVFTAGLAGWPAGTDAFVCQPGGRIGGAPGAGVPRLAGESACPTSAGRRSCGTDAFVCQPGGRIGGDTGAGVPRLAGESACPTLADQRSCGTDAFVCQPGGRIGGDTGAGVPRLAGETACPTIGGAL